MSITDLAPRTAETTARLLPALAERWSPRAFDADTVIDRATWDAPTEPSAGIEAVLVNGTQVYPTAPAARRPGRILRREAQAPQAQHNAPKETL